jgi:hypothetical protein
MTVKGIAKIMAAGLIFAISLSCGGSKEVIDPKAMLAYGKEPNEQNLDVLSKSYGAVINKNRKSGIKTPGVYSDYAVMMVKQGKRAEANGWFNKEMEAFPSSRGYVMQLKRRLIPEYQDDNSTTAAAADTVMAEPDAMTPAQRKRAEERAAAVLGDTTDVQTEVIETETTNEETIIEEDSEPLKDEEDEPRIKEDKEPENKEDNE